MNSQQNIATQQQILYVLLREPSALSECSLTSSDFTNQTDQLIFEAIQGLANENQAIDMVTVAERLENNHTAINMDYFINLFNNGIGSRKNLKSYVASVKKQSRRRKAANIAATLLESIEQNIEGDLVSNAIKDLMELDSETTSHSHTIGRCLRGALEHIQHVRESGGMVGIPTGLKALDEALGGFHDTDLIVVGARPAMGKTAFLLSTALGANTRAGIISAEQGYIQVGLRTISTHGSIESNLLRTANFTSSDQWAKLSGAVTSLQDRPIWVNDKPAISIGELVRQAREWKFNNDIKILFVDYIQKIRGSNPRATKTEQVTEVTGALKNIARELNIPVVALAQVKRDVETRPNKRPTMGDMSDASEIEKEADQIMTLYRDEVYNEQSDQKGIAELDIVKNRHGQIGVIRAKFIGRYFQFKDLSHTNWNE